MDAIITQKFENTSLFFSFFDTPVYVIEKLNAKIQTMGSNNKQIVFLVQYNENEFLPQNHLEIFNKILSALQLSMNDVLIANIRKGKDSVESILSTISWKKLISMGMPCSNNNFLQTLSLAEITASEENKKHFWTALKNYIA